MEINLRKRVKRPEMLRAQWSFHFSYIHVGFTLSFISSSAL
jgi:hypothetical protein